MRIVDGYFNQRVEAKLGTMRKARQFSVNPTSDPDVLLVQADKAIGKFNFKTREGVLNIKGEYFLHLSPAMGAKPYTFPAEFVALALEVCPALDSETERDGIILVNTIGGF